MRDVYLFGSSILFDIIVSSIPDVLPLYLCEEEEDQKTNKRGSNVFSRFIVPSNDDTESGWLKCQTAYANKLQDLSSYEFTDLVPFKKK